MSYRTTPEYALRKLVRRSGAEHEHQYFHGGCPECGIFYSDEFDWQHLTGCSRATADEPAKGGPSATLA